MSKRYKLLKDYLLSNGERRGRLSIVTSEDILLSDDVLEDNPDWFEPIAFQWSDWLVEQLLFIKGVHNPQKSINDYKNSLSQSIPAGKGTANETINEYSSSDGGEIKAGGGGGGQSTYGNGGEGWSPSRPFTTTIPDNPVLDRQDKEGSVNGASAEYGGFHDKKPERPWATSKSFKDNVIESFEEKFKAEGIQEYPTYNRQDKKERVPKTSIPETQFGLDKKERIEVTRISSTHVDDYDSKEAWIKATLSKHPDLNKMREVRQAIEQVLNEDTNVPRNYVKPDIDVDWGKVAKKFTEEDLKKAFEAGRATYSEHYRGVKFPSFYASFPTWESYKLSKLKSNDSR